MRCVPDILLKGSRWSPIARGVGEIGEQAFLFSAFKKLSHIGRIPPMPGCTWRTSLGQGNYTQAKDNNAIATRSSVEEAKCKLNASVPSHPSRLMPEFVVLP